MVTARALDRRAGEEARAQDEGEREQEVDRGDRPRQPEAVHRRHEVDGQVGDEARDDDAARRRPHVAHRDVAPPAVVEAEGDEDDELDPDDEQDRPVEQRASRSAAGRGRSGAGTRATRTTATIAASTSELPEPVRREELAHQTPSATPTAERTTSTTRSCASAGIPGQSGSEKFSVARLLGRRQRARLVAEEAQRRLQVERRRVVGRRRDAGLVERRADRVALARAADEEVVDVARLVLRDLDELAEAELGVAGGRGAARLRSSPRAPAGRCAGTRPAARRGASCSRRGRSRSCPASRGTRGAGRARRAPRRSSPRARRRRGRRGSSSG